MGAEKSLSGNFLPALFLMVISFSRVSAAAPVLEWPACRTEALASHPDIRASRESVRAAEAAFKSSRATYLPGLDATADYSRTHTGSDNFSYGLSASQRLYPGLQAQPEVAQAGARLDAARAAYDQVLADVLLDLRTAFSGLLYAQESIRLAESIAARREQNVQLVKARFEAGREHKGSFLLSQAAAQQSRFELRQVRRALRVAQRSLLKAMGRQEFSPVGVRGELAAEPAPESADVLGLAEQTPAVRQAVSNQQAAQAALAIVRQKYSPELSATASASRSGGEWPPRAKSGKWTGGVSVSVPLFTGGKDKNDVLAAEADLRRLADVTESAKQQKAQELEGNLAAYSDAVERVSIQDEFLAAGQVRAEISQAQYTNGLLSFENWDIIENDLIAQQKAALAARRDAVKAESAWNKSLGKGL